MSDARSFALKSRVILAQTATGIPIDVALGALDFEHRCVKRASEFDFGSGLNLDTCSAEDLVILKTFAGRGQDWVDVEYVLVRQRRTLDWRMIERELAPLLDLSGTPGNLEMLTKLRSKIEKGK